MAIQTSGMNIRAGNECEWSVAVMAPRVLHWKMFEVLAVLYVNVLTHRSSFFIYRLFLILRQSIELCYPAPEMSIHK